MWRRARDYVDLCECAARFAEGRLTSFPGWGAPGLDAESQPLAALLAGLCRAGFLTTASQPGTAIARQGYQQRAFVAGFLDAEALATLPSSGLCIAGIRSVALSRDGRGARVIGRAGTQEQELQLFRDAVPRRAWLELGLRAHVTLYDPVWGRNERLWTSLAEWISERPAPGRTARASDRQAASRLERSPRTRRPRPS
jgi:hypothetical protein